MANISSESLGAIGTLMLVLALVIPNVGQAQEVVIPGFPIGVGGSVDDSFFEPYYPQLQMIADTLKQYPLLHAVVIGGADGESFKVNNDAQNPGLALGRAHALRSVLLDHFGVDSTQLMIQTEDAPLKGPRFRHATVRIVWEMNDFKARLDDLASRPPIIEQPITQVTEVREVTRDLAEAMGLQLGGGFTSSPFGGMPYVRGAIVWQDQWYVEGRVGHALWNGSFDLVGEKLDTRLRHAAGIVSYFPFDSTRIGFMVGWMRVEQLAQKQYEYVKMAEGPMFGATWQPVEYASITGAYFPARQRIVGIPVKEDRIEEFILSVSFHVQFGGERGER